MRSPTMPRLAPAAEGRKKRRNPRAGLAHPSTAARPQPGCHPFPASRGRLLLKCREHAVYHAGAWCQPLFCMRATAGVPADPGIRTPCEKPRSEAYQGGIRRGEGVPDGFPLAPRRRRSARMVDPWRGRLPPRRRNIPAACRPPTSPGCMPRSVVFRGVPSARKNWCTRHRRFARGPAGHSPPRRAAA